MPTETTLTLNSSLREKDRWTTNSLSPRGACCLFRTQWLRATLDALTAHYTSTWKPEAAPVPGCAQDNIAVRGTDVFDSSRPNHFLAELTISSSVLHPDRDNYHVDQNSYLECCEEDLGAITYECRKLCTLLVSDTLTVDAIISKERYVLAVCSSDGTSGQKAFHSILDAVARSRSKLVASAAVVHSLIRERMLHEAQRLHREVEEPLPSIVLATFEPAEQASRGHWRPGRRRRSASQHCRSAGGGIRSAARSLHCQASSSSTS